MFYFTYSGNDQYFFSRQKEASWVMVEDSSLPATETSWESWSGLTGPTAPGQTESVWSFLSLWPLCWRMTSAESGLHRDRTKGHLVSVTLCNHSFSQFQDIVLKRLFETHIYSSFSQTVHAFLVNFTKNSCLLSESESGLSPSRFSHTKNLLQCFSALKITYCTLSVKSLRSHPFFQFFFI